MKALKLPQRTQKVHCGSWLFFGLFGGSLRCAILAKSLPWRLQPPSKGALLSPDRATDVPAFFFPDFYFALEKISISRLANLSSSVARQTVQFLGASVK